MTGFDGAAVKSGDVHTRAIIALAYSCRNRNRQYIHTLPTGLSQSRSAITSRDTRDTSSSRTSDAVADGDCAEHLGHGGVAIQPPPVEPIRLAPCCTGDGAVAIRYPNDRFSEILVTNQQHTQHRSVGRSLYTLSHLASEIIILLSF